MSFKKLLPVVALLPLATFAQTDLPSDDPFAITPKWNMPAPYKIGKHEVRDRGVAEIKETDETIIFKFTPTPKKNQQRGFSHSWETVCTKNEDKELTEPFCVIQSLANKQIYATITPKNTLIAFVPKAEGLGEVSYKVDSKSIKTSDSQYLEDDMFQNGLLTKMLKGEKLSYFYKIKNRHIVGRHSLDGFAENFRFAKRFLRANR